MKSKFIITQKELIGFLYFISSLASLCFLHREYFDWLTALCSFTFCLCNFLKPILHKLETIDPLQTSLLSTSVTLLFYMLHALLFINYLEILNFITLIPIFILLFYHLKLKKELIANQVRTIIIFFLFQIIVCLHNYIGYLQQQENTHIIIEKQIFEYPYSSSIVLILVNQMLISIYLFKDLVINHSIELQQMLNQYSIWERVKKTKQYAEYNRQATYQSGQIVEYKNQYYRLLNSSNSNPPDGIFPLILQVLLMDLNWTHNAIIIFGVSMSIMLNICILMTVEWQIILILTIECYFIIY